MSGDWAKVEAVRALLIWFRSSKDGMRGSKTGASDCDLLDGSTSACQDPLIVSFASSLSFIFFRLRDMGPVGFCRSFRFLTQIFPRRLQGDIEIYWSETRILISSRQIWLAIREHALDKPLTTGNKGTPDSHCGKLSFWCATSDIIEGCFRL